MDKPIRKKRILFVQDEAIRLGGTKVLIRRLGDAFLHAGYDVDILFKTNQASSSVLKILPHPARCFFLDPVHRSSWRFPFGSQSSIAKLHDEYDHIISMSVDGYCLALTFSQYAQLKGRNTYYVVNNDALRPENLKPLYRRILGRQADESFLFMNEECKQGLARALNRDFSTSRIVPLPVGEKQELRYKPPIVRKVVSIGRIDPVMKTYNWNLIGPLAQLRKEKVEFEWHIYGGGEQANITSLRHEITRHSACDFIIYHGELAYEDMQSVLSDACLFVGMGTSLVEAAALGLVGIAATAYAKEPEANGYFHELPFGNVGEASHQIKPVPTISLIASVLDLEYSAYLTLRKKSALAAKKYFLPECFNQLVDALDETRDDEGKYASSKGGMWFHYQFLRVLVGIKRRASARLLLNRS